MARPEDPALVSAVHGTLHQPLTPNRTMFSLFYTHSVDYLSLFLS